MHTNKTIIIIDKQDRSRLSEGRNYQMGFAFVKKDPDSSTFHTIQPISPCKDYLNDVILAEALNVTVSAWGLKVSKNNLFENNTPPYLVFKICGQGASTAKEYTGMKDDVARLEKNLDEMRKALHYIETSFQFKSHSTIDHTNTEGLYLATLAPEWAASTYMISIVSLLLRVLQYIDLEKYKNYEEFLECFAKATEHSSPDKGLWAQAYPKFKHILKTKKLPEQVFENYRTRPGSVHNDGILSYSLQ